MVPLSTVLDNLIAVLKGGAPGDRITAARRLGNLRAEALSAGIEALLGESGTSDPELRTAIGVARGRSAPLVLVPRSCCSRLCVLSWT